MGSYIRPSSFHTFDPIRLSPESLIGPINESMTGSHERLLGLVGRYNVLPELKEGGPSPIDRATSLFISTLDWQDSGDAPRALDGGHSRERLGRFPQLASKNGNTDSRLVLPLHTNSRRYRFRPHNCDPRHTHRRVDMGSYPPARSGLVEIRVIAMFVRQRLL